MSFGQAAKLLKQNLQLSRATRLLCAQLIVGRAHASEKKKNTNYTTKRQNARRVLADPPQVLGPRVPPHELGPVHDEAVRHPIHDAARERERLHAAPRLDEDHP